MKTTELISGARSPKQDMQERSRVPPILTLCHSPLGHLRHGTAMVTPIKTLAWDGSLRTQKTQLCSHLGNRGQGESFKSHSQDFGFKQTRKKIE